MKTLLFISTLFTTLAFGKVIDPHNIRGYASVYLGFPSFEDSFAVGDWHKSVNRACVYSQGSEDCTVELNETEVEKVETDFVKIKNGGQFPRAIFDKYQGQYLDFLLEILTNQNLKSNQAFALPKSIQGAAIIELKNAFVIENSNGLEVLEIEMDYISNDNGRSFTLPMYVQLAASTPWFAQIVMMGIGEASDLTPYSPFYEVISWSKTSNADDDL